MTSGENEGYMYVCIECNHPAKELYKDYNGGVIRIAHCTGCNTVVDKYIEQDPVLIFLDALLHKPQAYRHLLINQHLHSHGKLLFIFLICDAFTQWAQNQPQGVDTSSQSDFIFYAALELNFYKMFITVLIEFIVFICGVTLTLQLSKALNLQNFNVRFKYLIHGLIVSNFGKLLVVPAVIWGQSNSALYMWLTRLFTFTSNMQAIKVMLGCSHIWAFVVILNGCIGSLAVNYWMRTILWDIL
ncbi:unnamed protein product [Owenia fusiformis]|uniref:Protein ARV n=1 Tax=Owenia fusiformis TaxID=6347 RepID=A0A8J1Y561_OWEFU|nr:unnamed protein product [Owenia fusiformis]